MTKLNQIYKCNICGNMVGVVHEGAGQLVCCGEPMELLEEKNKDEGAEKHVPVIEKLEKSVMIKIGSVPHPMEKEHFIEWVEVFFDDKVARKFFQPGDSPQLEFDVNSENLSVRAYCNVHGLWKKK
ncbi:MAG: desulfoferrodoxin [Candidatus Pacebacteria bacterium]|nr:desulfoferrodoxin [Candidatus Paceibacterota bacterium]